MLNFFKKLKFAACALIFFVLVPSSALAANHVIDILVVYTKGTSEAYGGNPKTRINQLFQFTNQIYLDSDIDLEIRVAHTMMVDYPDNTDAITALHDITFEQVESLKGVALAREQAKADMVIFYRPFQNAHGSCGQAWVGGVDSHGDFSAGNHKDYMYSHIPINGCGDFTTAHELGHNMGLRHSRKQDGAGGTLGYALGYGEINKFTTIMAYQSEFNVDFWDGKVYKFSSPQLLCKGLPCGIDREDLANGADARHALTITTPQIANFYASQTESSEASSASSASSVSSASSLSSNASLITSSSSSVTNIANNPPPSSDSGGGSGGGSTDWFIFLSLGVLMGLGRVARGV